MSSRSRAWGPRSFVRSIGVYEQLRSIPKPGSFFVVLFVVASSDDFPMHFSIRQARQHSDPGGHESQAAPDVLGGSRVTPPNIRTRRYFRMSTKSTPPTKMMPAIPSHAIIAVLKR